MKSKTLFSLVVLTLVTSLIPAAHAQTFSVLYTFTGGADGTGTEAGVTIRGNALYGTTLFTVYQLTNTGSSWHFSTLASNWGADMLARAVFGPDGHLYSTSFLGGTNFEGSIFKLAPPVGVCKTVACYWKVNDLHDFGSGTDGIGPFFGDLIWDQQGNIYGTTQAGGTSQNCDGFSCGTVYELTPSGDGYTENVIYNFSGTDGAYPVAGVVFDNNGNLFGTTDRGGTNGDGTVFELTYVVGVGWTEHVLYNFQNASDGEIPLGGLIFDSAGNLYGTTADGGSGGGGTVFELSPSGNTWTFKLLYSFTGQGSSGPEAALTMDGAGNLYGTTLFGGKYNNGSVFKLSKAENGWIYTSLHDFTGGTDGGYAFGGVNIGSDGTLYGASSEGGNIDQYNCGSGGCGVVWMIKP